MACTIAFIILWYLEYRRTTLIESYWLALAALASLMGYQYIRMTSKTEKKEAGNEQKTQVGKLKPSISKSSKKKK